MILEEERAVAVVSFSWVAWLNASEFAFNRAEMTEDPCSLSARVEERERWKVLVVRATALSDLYQLPCPTPPIPSNTRSRIQTHLLQGLQSALSLNREIRLESEVPVFPISSFSLDSVLLLHDNVAASRDSPILMIDSSRAKVEEYENVKNGDLEVERKIE